MTAQAGRTGCGREGCRVDVVLERNRNAVQRAQRLALLLVRIRSTGRLQHCIDVEGYEGVELFLRLRALEQRHGELFGGQFTLADGSSSLHYAQFVKLCHARPQKFRF